MGREISCLLPHGRHTKTAELLLISLSHYGSVTDMFSDLIDLENNCQAVATWNHIMWLCIWSRLWAICSGLNLKRETAKASHTSRGFTIFKPTFGHFATLCPPQAVGAIIKPNTKTLSLRAKLQRRTKVKHCIFSLTLGRWVLVHFDDVPHICAQLSCYSGMVLHLARSWPGHSCGPSGD